MTRNDWILDVLADLKEFASSADLPRLAEQLDDTALIALAEIASVSEETQRQAYAQDPDLGTHTGGIGAS
jgi:hypothetical protein